jgi:hypothetical protein
VTQQSNFYPSFGKDGNAENKLILINEGEHDGDENKFNIEHGNYRIRLNLSTLDIEITNN